MKLEHIEKANSLLKYLKEINTKINRLECYKGRLVLKFEPEKVSFLNNPEHIEDKELVDLVYEKHLESLKEKAKNYREEIEKL